MNKDQLIDKILFFSPLMDNSTGMRKLSMLDMDQLQQQLDLLERMAKRSEELRAARQGDFPSVEKEAVRLTSNKKEILARMEQSMIAFSNRRKEAEAVRQAAQAPRQRAEPVHDTGGLVIKVLGTHERSHQVQVVVMNRNGQVVEFLGKKYLGRVASKNQGSELVQKYRTWVEKGAEPTAAAVKLFSASPTRQQRFKRHGTALKTDHQLSQATTKPRKKELA